MLFYILEVVLNIDSELLSFICLPLTRIRSSDRLFSHDKTVAKILFIQIKKGYDIKNLNII